MKKKNISLLMISFMVSFSRFTPSRKEPVILKMLRSYSFTTVVVVVVVKNTMVAQHYGRVSETPCFPGENSQEISTDSELIRR